MQLTAIFEGWLLGDGCYPPLHRGQLVNLAFELRPTALRRCRRGPGRFQSMGDAGCWLRGAMTRVYLTEDPPVAVLEAGGFRCYVESPEVRGWQPGVPIAATGTLAVDYYVWSEFLADRYADAPNLFYPLRVTRIRRVQIPEESVIRTERSLAAPATVPLDDVAAENVEEVETMLYGDHAEEAVPALSSLAAYTPAFYLVDFADDDLPPEQIRRTFQ